MQATRPGKFRARPGARGVSETRESKICQFSCECILIEELVNGEWCAIEEDVHITSFSYLEKTDGSLNTVTIDALKAAFGWDGLDPFWLQDANMDHVTIQVDLDFETYKNQQRLRVKWINPGDAVPGGVKQASDDDRRAISNRLGSKFRANAGGVAVAVPKPATRPAPVTPKPPAGKQATRDEAWAAFSSNRHVKEGCATQDKLEATWFEIVGRMFPNRDADKLMTSDWSKFIATFEANLAPF